VIVVGECFRSVGQASVCVRWAHRHCHKVLVEVLLLVQCDDIYDFLLPSRTSFNERFFFYCRCLVVGMVSSKCTQVGCDEHHPLLAEGALWFLARGSEAAQCMKGTHRMTKKAVHSLFNTSSVTHALPIPLWRPIRMPPTPCKVALHDQGRPELRHAASNLYLAPESSAKATLLM
jgi:hypothetical protein